MSGGGEGSRREREGGYGFFSPSEVNVEVGPNITFKQNLFKLLTIVYVIACLVSARVFYSNT